MNAKVNIYKFFIINYNLFILNKSAFINARIVLLCIGVRNVRMRIEWGVFVIVRMGFMMMGNLYFVDLVNTLVSIVGV